MSSAKGFTPSLGLGWGVSAFAATGVYIEKGLLRSFSGYS